MSPGTPISSTPAALPRSDSAEPTGRILARAAGVHKAAAVAAPTLFTQVGVAAGQAYDRISVTPSGDFGSGKSIDLPLGPASLRLPRNFKGGLTYSTEQIAISATKYAYVGLNERGSWWQPRVGIAFKGYTLHADGRRETVGYLSIAGLPVWKLSWVPVRLVAHLMARYAGDQIEKKLGISAANLMTALTDHGAFMDLVNDKMQATPLRLRPSTAAVYDQEGNKIGAEGSMLDIDFAVIHGRLNVKHAVVHVDTVDPKTGQPKRRLTLDVPLTMVGSGPAPALPEPAADAEAKMVIGLDKPIHVYGPAVKTQTLVARPDGLYAQIQALNVALAKEKRVGKPFKEEDALLSDFVRRGYLAFSGPSGKAGADPALVVSLPRELRAEGFVDYWNDAAGRMQLNDNQMKVHIMGFDFTANPTVTFQTYARPKSADEPDTPTSAQAMVWAELDAQARGAVATVSDVAAQTYAAVGNFFRRCWGASAAT